MVSKLAGQVRVSLVSVVGVVWYLSLRGVDHDLREVVQNVVCLCVCDTETSRMRRLRSNKDVEP